LNLFSKEFYEAMDNDFNTPIALSSLFEFTHKINKALNDNELSENTLNLIIETLSTIEDILGFTIITSDDNNDLSNELLNLVTNIRQDLRAKKDWDLADKIRDELSKLDISLEDK
jgi:cysteinyl-tRNA synthetase